MPSADIFQVKLPQLLALYSKDFDENNISLTAKQENPQT